MKDENVPPLLGDNAEPPSGCGWFVIGVIVALAVVAAVSIALIAEPLYRSLR